MIILLRGATRGGTDRPCSLPWGCELPLLGLAPGGVYPATPVTSGPVRSYRHPFTLTRVNTGGLLSVALSFESPRLAYASTLSCGARTFLDEHSIAYALKRRRDHLIPLGRLSLRPRGLAPAPPRVEHKVCAIPIARGAKG